MILYIDIYLLHNTLINSLIFILTGIITKIRASHPKIFLCSFLASLVSLLLMFLPFYITVILKIIIVVPMCMFVFESKNTMLLKNSIAFILSSLLLSGVISSLNSRVNYHSYVGIPIIVFAVAGICLLIVLNIILKYILKQTIRPELYKNVCIEMFDKTVVLNGYCDTGNNLMNNNKPVFVINSDTFYTLVGNNEIKFKMLNIKTITGKDTIKIFTPEKIKIDNVEVEADIGISNCFFSNEYDILLSDLESHKIKTETEKIYA